MAGPAGPTAPIGDDPTSAAVPVPASGAIPVAIRLTMRSAKDVRAVAAEAMLPAMMRGNRGADPSGPRNG